jgi:hypothetical protein
MSCIRHAISKIKQVIPAAILEKAFTPRAQGWFPQLSWNLDKCIELEVIRAVVLPDCNVVGGTEIVIQIGDLNFDRVNNDIIIRVPKERTQNRSIVSITDILFASLGANSFYPSALTSGYRMNQDHNDTSATMGALKTMMASLDHIPVVGTSKAELIGENVILIQAPSMISSNACARVVVEYDSELTNISPRSYDFFAELAEHAVKNYIYNKLVIQIDTAELQGGYNLGIFKEIVSGYSESGMNYRTFLRGTWMKVAMMNDRKRHERLISAMIGGQAK